MFATKADLDSQSDPKVNQIYTAIKTKGAGMSTLKQGIDISKWQGAPDWDKLAAAHKAA